MDNRKNQVSAGSTLIPGTTLHPGSTLHPFETPSCFAELDGQMIKLVSPYFEYHLSQEKELHSIAWKNRMTSDSLLFAKGTELEVDIDQSKQRINIVGWRTIISQEARSAPNDETGYTHGYAAYSFDDSSWIGRNTPVPFRLNESHSVPQEDHFHWARTHVFLPEDVHHEPVTLTLGGIGMFRFTYMRVFVNGIDLGEYEQQQRWNEPFDIALTPYHPAYAHLRFGQDNVIALQLSGLTTRTDELKAIDPKKTRYLPYKNCWPCQFEQYVTIRKRVQTLSFHVIALKKSHEADRAELTIHLAADQLPFTAQLTYRWQADRPTLHKYVTLQHAADEPMMLLHVRLGQYALNHPVSSGEQGFPVYVHDQYFMSIAHPSGWAMGQHQTVTLKQYPGKRLQLGEPFHTMETIYGVADTSQAQPAFIAHVTERMRRVVRKHDKAYAIYEPFGARKMEKTDSPPPFILYETEEFLVDNLQQLAEMEKVHPARFDYYCLQFWANPKGDFTTADPTDFPHDLAVVNREVQALNMKLGLWIDSSWTVWSIGQNPVTKPSVHCLPDYGTEDYLAFCRASEPIHTLYTNGFLHHLRHNDVGLLKFDNLWAICYNPHHEHLPGIYSTEAIQSKVITFLNRLDQENPDVFMMLYWGYRSPWWLLHGDTLFEPGLHLEASHPGPTPTMYVRDSVTKGLDQAHWWCKDIPQLGKDSLGVWLSDWPWNCSVGKERWQDAFIMDMFRGGLLAQPWGHDEGFTLPEGKELAHFIHIMREHADCFQQAQLFLGHPWEDEAYGYIASNGKRTFIVILNCVWQDGQFQLDFNQLLPQVEVSACELYRHYPNPVQFTVNANQPHFPLAEPITMALRPFETLFMEIVPIGERSLLSDQVDLAPYPRQFAQASCELQLQLEALPDNQAKPVPHETYFGHQIPAYMAEKVNEGNTFPPKRNWTITAELPPTASGGVFVVSCQLHQEHDYYLTVDIGNYFACEVEINHTPCHPEPVLGNWTLQCSWQAWRIQVNPSPHSQTVKLHVTLMTPAHVQTQFSSHFIPN